MDEETQESPEQFARMQAFDAHRVQFYALIGHCTTRYQSVEDHLKEVFAAAMGGDRSRAQAIFHLMRGLDTKLDAIGAALTGGPTEHLETWSELRKRVEAAARARNQIAHASPVVTGAPIKLIMGKDGQGPVRVERSGGDWMELRKASKSGATVWTVELMREEAERAYELFGALIEFGTALATGRRA